MGIRTSATCSARNICAYKKKPEGHMTTHVLPWYQAALDAKNHLFVAFGMLKTYKYRQDIFWYSIHVEG